MTKIARLLAVSLALAALAAGCGSDEEGSPGAPEAGKEGGTEAATTRDGGGAEGGPRGAAARTCEPEVAKVASLRATGVDCGLADAVADSWRVDPRCKLASGSSRGTCQVRNYRCLSTVADRGISVNCSARRSSISFLVPRR